MTETVDQEARKLASQAHEKAGLAMQAIEAHKDSCEVRWQETKDMIKGLYSRWWWLMTTIIIGMGTVIYLLLRYVLEID